MRNEERCTAKEKQFPESAVNQFGNLKHNMA